MRLFDGQKRTCRITIYMREDTSLFARQCAPFSMRYLLCGLFCGFLMFFAGILLWSSFSYSKELRINNMTVSLADRSPVRVRVCIPRQGGRMPGVIVSHGMSCNKEMMDGLSREIARNGFVVLTPDFENDDPDRNTEIIRMLIPHLQKMADGEGIALAGHSLGALEVVDAAFQEPPVKATVAFGLFIGGELNLPMKNLLLATGFYDRIFPPEERIASIRSVTDGKVDTPGVLWGSFSDLSAREFLISPCSQHSSEVIDPVIISGIVTWIGEALQGKNAGEMKPLILAWNMAGSWITYGGILLLCLFLPVLAAVSDHKASLPAMGVYVSIPVAAGVLALSGAMDGSPAMVMILVAPCALIVADYFICTASDPSRSVALLLAKGTLWLSLFVVFLSLSVFFFEMPVRDAAATRAFPAYFITSYVAYPLFYIESSLRHMTDSSALQACVLMCCSFLLIVGEFLYPGVAGKWIAGLWRYCMLFRKAESVSRSKICIAGILFAAATGAWIYAFSTIRLTGFMVMHTGSEVLKIVVVPLVMTVALFSLAFRKRKRR